MNNPIGSQKKALAAGGYERLTPPKGKLCSLGIDIGSISSDIVLIDAQGRIITSNYRRTYGRPAETLHKQLTTLSEYTGTDRLSSVAATGSAARKLAECLNIPLVNEVTAQAEAIATLHPDLDKATIIEMGGQDNKLIFLSKDGDGRSCLSDFALNAVCAAGTGSFLDQQAKRLGVEIENEFGRLAMESKNVPRMAGRCSVFAKSDMIHLQQQATPNCDIVAGLCQALARNLKSDLGRGREFIKPIIFTGGVAANKGVVNALRVVFDLAPQQLIVPEQHFFTGAIGSLLVAAKRQKTEACELSFYLGRLEEYIHTKAALLKKAPRLDRLNQPVLAYPKSRVCGQLLDNSVGITEAYLGVDVGSISTNVAVIDRKKRVLAKAYLMTAGRPLEAVRRGLDIVGTKVEKKVDILAAATTGSGRYLTGDFIGADVVINEITAQAAGAAIVNPNVDTIFEIGGQDSKYISLDNGVVVDFEMNHACAAGTGSFLEEQAQRLGIDIKGQFAELALSSPSPIKLGERCTVFMESDLLNYQQQGAKIPELVAGLSYSIVTNYLNRVVGRRRIGNNICFQGGTAFNKAVWAAFEKITGKPIMVPDHHEVTGAIGAAAIAKQYMEQKAGQKGRKIKSKFRGFGNLAHIKYTVESFSCGHCPNNCEIKKVELPGSEPLYYGSRCDRYNIRTKETRAAGFNAFQYQRKKLLEFAGLDGNSPAGGNRATKKTIGIPMALINWQLLPLFSRFFKALGFDVVLSGRTTKKTIRDGTETVTAQPCFPVKVAYGHVVDLLNRNPDYIFIPSIVSMTPVFAENKYSQLCPFIQSFVYQIKTAFAGRFGGTKLLTVPIRLGEGQRLLKKGFTKLAKQLYASSASAASALQQALEAQKLYEGQLKRKGEEIINALPAGKRLFVLISRPYNGCDEAVNLQLTRKLSQLGVEIIPLEMLDLTRARLSDEYVHRSMYWTYGQKILRAAEIISTDPRLFAIYLSNFGCGPDSFLQSFFKDIMGKKPTLLLELDEHSADAGLITRLEAFLESLKNYKPGGAEQIKQHRSEEKISAEPLSHAAADVKRHVYIPYMSDCSYALAACIRGYGRPADVMPVAGQKALIKGRHFTTGKECLPCAITAGEMLSVAQSDDFIPEQTTFFMPTTSGPCRFGMYNCLHRYILRYAGYGRCEVAAPNQDEGFYNSFGECFGGGSKIGFVRDIWVAMIVVDLLGKLILKLRPLAADAKKAQDIYRKSLGKWLRAVEERAPVSAKLSVLKSIDDDFSNLELDLSADKPKIGIVGEIYVRNHPFANLNIVQRLEKLGAVCELASLAEWVYYTNYIRKRAAWRTGQFKSLFYNSVVDIMQHRLEKKFAGPLERRFGPLVDCPVEHVIDLARPYLDESFEGEAILSIGKTIEFYHQGAAGVVNVMPFNCMPSTVVSTQTKRISSACDGMPVLSLSFDGQQDALLTTRLEAFVEQVKQRRLQATRQSRITVAGSAAAGD